MPSSWMGTWGRLSGGWPKRRVCLSFYPRWRLRLGLNVRVMCSQRALYIQGAGRLQAGVLFFCYSNLICGSLSSISDAAVRTYITSLGANTLSDLPVRRTVLLPIQAEASLPTRSAIWNGSATNNHRMAGFNSRLNAITTVATKP